MSSFLFFHSNLITELKSNITDQTRKQIFWAMSENERGFGLELNTKSKCKKIKKKQNYLIW